MKNVRVTVVLLSLVAILGCGGSDGDNTVRFNLSGNVSFQGQPVATGNIVFMPDGGSGPSGFAKIENGKFDTAVDGKGHVGGRQVIRIKGFDGVKDLENDVLFGSPLFPEYSTKKDLPESDSTMDFVVEVVEEVE